MLWSCLFQLPCLGYTKELYLGGGGDERELDKQVEDAPNPSFPVAGSEKISPFSCWYRTWRQQGVRTGICHLSESLIIRDAPDYCKTSPIVKRGLVSKTAAKSEPLVRRVGWWDTATRLHQLLLQQVTSCHTFFVWERSDNQHSVRRREKVSLGFTSVKTNVINYAWPLIYLRVSIHKMVESFVGGREKKTQTQNFWFSLVFRNYPLTWKQSYAKEINILLLLNSPNVS